MGVEPVAELKLISLADLEDHPDNPRLFDRQEVIDAIVAGLDGEYPQKHAVHARPLPRGKYQLVSGHHRKKAALKKGLKAVWAWVEDMTDEEALMQLVLANNQGELAPLEIGLHLLKAVPPEKGGRGKKGGLSAYAEQIGRDRSYVSRLREAGEVAEAVKPVCPLTGFLDRAMHLCEVHDADPPLWPVLVQALLAESAASKEAGKGDTWTVEHTREVVKRLAACLKVCPERWQRVYLTPALVAEVVVKGAKPPVFTNLVQLATYIADRIQEHRRALPEGTAEDFEAFLAAGGPSWEVKGLQDYRAKIEALVETALPEGRYRVVLVDAPWRYDFAETGSRQVENQYGTLPLDDIKAYPVPAAEDSVLFLWAAAPKLREALEVMEAWGFEYKTHFVWDKEKIGMGYWCRGQHELLLVGTRGNFAPPEPSRRFSSMIRAPRGRHSAKPTAVYELIEAMWPDFGERERAELFARTKRRGWTVFGNEVNEPAAGGAAPPRPAPRGPDDRGTPR
jgi:N6-adenosine-specific RNA methylase IME4